LKIDASIMDPFKAGETARELESSGYDGGFTFEGPHDPFFPLVVASQTTERLELSTAIAIAFARNPMILANIGWDLQAYSKGRFMLGLGSQIRPHIEKRFSMRWGKPVAQMREMVMAIKEIWRCWAEGDRLDFRGEYYQHTLMIPMFNPGRNEYGNPPILLAGVGPKMTEAAGEVADGFFVHPLNTERSVREVTMPAIERGLEKSGRVRKDFQMSFQVMVAAGHDDEQIARAREGARAQIAFYASTPAYKVVLDAEGFGDLQPQLNRMTKEGRWAEIPAQVPDALVDAVAVCCHFDDLADRLRARCGELADRLHMTAHWSNEPDRFAAVARELNGSS
jgi:probable F420-dependent oxidoreductase